MQNNRRPANPPATQRADSARKLEGIQLRPRVPMLDENKRRVRQLWRVYGKPEAQIAKEYGIRREHVELILHELDVEDRMRRAA